MKNYILLSSIMIAIFILIGCDYNPDSSLKISGKIYVIVPENRNAVFTEDLAKIVSRYHMTPNLGKAIDDKGNALFVLDAVGSNIRLRSENILLSGQEDSERCGIHTEPYADPGQYFISISASGSQAKNQEAMIILENISLDLVRLGFDVREKPTLCSADTVTQLR